MARKKRSEAINPNARKHNLKFGWCTDNNHPACRISYVDWNLVEQECSCECHKEKK